MSKYILLTCALLVGFAIIATEAQVNSPPPNVVAANNIPSASQDLADLQRKNDALDQASAQQQTLAPAPATVLVPVTNGPPVQPPALLPNTLPTTPAPNNTMREAAPGAPNAVPQSNNPWLKPNPWANTTNNPWAPPPGQPPNTTQSGNSLPPSTQPPGPIRVTPPTAPVVVEPQTPGIVTPQTPPAGAAQPAAPPNIYLPGGAQAAGSNQNR